MWLPASSSGQTALTAVRFSTTLGNIDVTLFPSTAPKTVANFLNYVNSGAYNNSFIHRSVPNFIIQGGGYQFVNGNVVTITAGATVPNEYSLPNTRGTIAMAQLSGDPNSATDQWFFNLVDNSATLDSTSNGPFTVFGQIANAGGLAVMDAIAAVQVYNIDNATFSQIPLINYTGGSFTAQNLVTITSIGAVPMTAVNNGGVISASGFGAFSAVAPGSFAEIYGTNLAGTTRGWNATDFTNGAAPTILDGVTVTVNGQRAYVVYISPDLVNIQVPAGVPNGPVPVVVSYEGQSTAPVTVMVNSLEGGLLAPATFNVGGKQYVVAVHASTGAIVSSGNIPGSPAAPAVPGETLVLYGIGFGPVTPSGIPLAGQIVSGTSTLVNPVQVSIGNNAAAIGYQGFAPGEVGLYQFNVTVPANTPSGDVSLQLSQAGTALPQTLFLSVQ